MHRLAGAKIHQRVSGRQGSPPRRRLQGFSRIDSGDKPDVAIKLLGRRRANCDHQTTCRQQKTLMSASRMFMFCSHKPTPILSCRTLRPEKRGAAKQQHNVVSSTLAAERKNCGLRLGGLIGLICRLYGGARGRPRQGVRRLALSDAGRCGQFGLRAIVRTVGVVGTFHRPKRRERC